MLSELLENHISNKMHYIELCSLIYTLLSFGRSTLINKSNDLICSLLINLIEVFLEFDRKDPFIMRNPSEDDLDPGLWQCSGIFQDLSWIWFQMIMITEDIDPVTGNCLLAAFNSGKKTLAHTKTSAMSWMLWCLLVLNTFSSSPNFVYSLFILSIYLQYRSHE